MQEYVHMIHNSSKILEDVLEGNMKVVGFEYITMNKKIKVPFVLSKKH